jgi:hypothetical protein
MRYLRVRWRQDSAGEPVILYSEVDDEGWEVRKVDVYANGRRDLAGEGIETGSTFLAGDRTPSLEEINGDAQFEATEIDGDEFERIWADAKAWFELP